MTSAYDACLITINYRNPHDTKRLLDSVSSQEGRERLLVLVVDNESTASSRDALNEIVATFAGPCHVLPFGSNLYYWGGAAAAVAWLRQQTNLTPSWYLICNNDVVLEERVFLERLTRHSPLQDVIIAPGITSLADGRQQNPFLVAPFGPLARLKWRLYFAHYWIAASLLRLRSTCATMRIAVTGAGARRAEERAETGRSTIHAAHGAFVILSQVFFELGGYLDTDFRMYGEEMSLAGVARALGLPIIFDPELRVWHGEHSTTGRGLSRNKYDMEREAHMHFVRKYGW